MTSQVPKHSVHSTYTRRRILVAILITLCSHQWEVSDPDIEVIILVIDPLSLSSPSDKEIPRN